MLRDFVYIVAAALMMVSCGGRQTQYATASHPVDLRTITIDNESAERGVSDTLRLGRLHSGEVIAKTIRVKNESNEPVVFTRHHVSCGCISVQYDRKPIAKGQSGDINIKFDSRTMNGLQLKTLVLYFAEKGRPMRIFVEAEVE